MDTKQHTNQERKQQLQQQLRDLAEQIVELERTYRIELARIDEFPKGSLTIKKVKGKEYYYHRWTEHKKRMEKYIPQKDVEKLLSQMALRDELLASITRLQEKSLKLRLRYRNVCDELAQLEDRIAKESESMNPASATLSKASWNGRSSQVREEMTFSPSEGASSHEFATVVRLGNSLQAFASPVSGYEKRECYQALHDFVYGDVQDKVLILFGLRRTGKTTLIRQLLGEMSSAELSRTAFLQITARNTMADVNRDLRYLEQQGYRTVFLDEVTLMDDFVQGAALFSDVFAACGMKLVLSGTDSLGFLFTQDEQLYDRCILVHTTFIPYREFDRVLGIQGIDEYIRYGGTMSLSGTHYNENSSFSTEKDVSEYVDAAIARNIQHSLRCYQEEGHFRSLQELYEKNELTSAIQRIVEDMNHRFTLDVLTRDFRSHDLATSARNLRSDRDNPNDILDRIDLPQATRKLRELLEIRNQAEQTVSIDQACVTEIEEYLHLLDLVQTIDVISLSNLNQKNRRTVIAQPGLRYAQADALIRSLLLDEKFADLALPERNAVCQRILSEISGRMMEDIVLLETKLANPRKEVFVLQFPIGEFDMVVFDPAAGNCQAYEIKHSTEAVPAQYRHLVDEEKCRQTEHRYGPILQKTVLYRGESHTDGDICYQNVEEYLKGLKA